MFEICGEAAGRSESISADNDIITERARVQLVSTARIPPSERAPETPLDNKRDRRHQLLSAHSIQQDEVNWTATVAKRSQTHISFTGKVFQSFSPVC